MVKDEEGKRRVAGDEARKVSREPDHEGPCRYIRQPGSYPGNGGGVGGELHEF